jgi:hypothetical protein
LGRDAAGPARRPNREDTMLKKTVAALGAAAFARAS